MAADISHQWAPLQQVRVLNLGTAWAGRVASMLLADQGADVVEVQRPGSEPHPCDPLLGRGKRLVEVDLKRDGGRIADLAAGTDIVIENMRPGVTDRLGLGYEALRDRNPGLVYLGLPGFAEGDPNRDLPAWEGVINAAAGIYTDINPVGALLGRDPIYSAIPMASAYGGILGACTASLGFYHRQRTGIGQRFEVPLADAVLSAMALLIVEVEGKPPRYGFPPIDSAMADTVFTIFRDLSEHLTPEHVAKIAGYLRTLSTPMVNTYPCADGRLLFMVASDHMYQTRAFLEVVGVYEKLIADGMVAASPYAESGLDNNLYEANKLSGAWREHVRTAIAHRLATKPAQEWETRLRNANVPVTVVRTAAEWLEQAALYEGGVTADLHDADLGVVRQAGRFVSIEGSQTASPALASRSRAEGVVEWRDAALDYPQTAQVAANTPILQGLKVLDFSNIIAGPAAGRTLAEFGADVIRIDAPAPQAGPFATMWFGIDVNQGKRAIIVDLKTDTGRTALAQLVQDTDVVLHNFLDRSAQSLGISHEQLVTINPNIISCQISAWGGATGGPFKDDPAFDPVLQAASGIMMRYGSEARPVLHGIASCVDYMTGFSAVLGIAQALAARQMGRGGSYVRTSLAMAAQLVQFPFMTKYGNWAPGSEPGGQDAKGEDVHQHLYRLADGWAFVGFRPGEGQAVVVALGGAEATVEGLAGRLRTLTLKQVQERLAAIPGAGVGAVCTLAELREARTMKGSAENGLPSGSFVLVRGPHPSGFPTTLPLPTWFRPSQSRICYLHPAPFPGEHTVEVLKEAGWAGPEIEQMIADGVARTGWPVLPHYLPE